MPRNSVVAALSLLAAVFTATNAKADIIVGGNMGSSYSYSSTGSWATGDGGNSGNAVSFVAPIGSNYQLDQIAIAENYYAGSDPLNVALYQGVDPNSATLVYSYDISPASLSSGSVYLFTQTVSSGPLLIGGDTYWLEETIADCGIQSSCSTTFGWQYNDLTPTPETGYDSEFAGGLWFVETGTTPAFQVNGTPVSLTATPEPGTFLLSSLPMALFFLKRRRN